YASLSYCWGKQQTFITTKATAATHLKGMPLSLLHGTIRDAVITTRRLGIPFLWADALCIIQDCSDDKTAEISKMGDIYTNAILTISAAGANDCDEGFLITRQGVKERYEEKSKELQYLCPDGALGKMNLVATGHDHLNDEHPEAIYERAWTHQERMLSPRMLTFGRRKLSWQCLTSSHCDFDIEDRHFGSATLDIRKFLHDISTPSTNATRPKDLPSRSVILRWWREVVHGYSQGRLSELPDKLTALSATARRFGWALQSQYVHGLWGDHLIRDMMW
ncbi:heterokaryon incompatibility protein-domain-containing protein, partial [Podospora australis]